VQQSCGTDVAVLDRNPEALRRVDAVLGNRVRTLFSMPPLMTSSPSSIKPAMSKEDHHEYYNGFTNRVLWPILHYRVDLAEFSRRDLGGYLRVNDHFARELHEVLGPDESQAVC
jgi:hypothetical protein